jgi:hypothetical protein
MQKSNYTYSIIELTVVVPYVSISQKHEHQASHQKNVRGFDITIGILPGSPQGSIHVNGTTRSIRSVLRTFDGQTLVLSKKAHLSFSNLAYYIREDDPYFLWCSLAMYDVTCDGLARGCREIAAAGDEGGEER